MSENRDYTETMNKATYRSRSWNSLYTSILPNLVDITFHNVKKLSFTVSILADIMHNTENRIVVYLLCKDYRIYFNRKIINNLMNNVQSDPHNSTFDKICHGLWYYTWCWWIRRI